jgi:hypothetical protein
LLYINYRVILWVSLWYLAALRLTSCLTTEGGFPICESMGTDHGMETNVFFFNLRICG